jgi:hypothetical protein
VPKVNVREVRRTVHVNRDLHERDDVASSVYRHSNSAMDAGGTMSTNV